MTQIDPGQVVQHRSDVGLGEGKVKFAESVAGVQRVFVQWASGSSISQHTPDELHVLQRMPDRLDGARPSSRVPFQLQLFGRWFEARHALTGELANQPFQMLPHQVVVANRVVNSASDRRAWLIADDVGLGKTIEAGMIIEVLRKKTPGRFRCLIVTPAGLLPQWKDELATRFGREYRIFESRTPSDLDGVDQLIASIDTLKAKKFVDTLKAASPWDVVVFDEAHHLATTPNILTYQLAHRLRELSKARNLLFLSATPHSGNDEHFFNMIRILRPDLFAKDTHAPAALNQVMIRNRKSDVTDANHQKIFRGIGPAQIIAFEPTDEEVEFAEALREYLRNGYGVAERLLRQKDGKTKARAVGLLMSTFGKIASSSRAAIAGALDKRIDILSNAISSEEDADDVHDGDDVRFEGEREERLVGKRAVEVRTTRGKKLVQSLIDNELAQVRELRERVQAVGTKDTKLESLIARLKDLPPDLKLLIFTEFRATQAVLVEAIEANFGAKSTVIINGEFDMNERRERVRQFNESGGNPRFMVSTEAGGEGLNMQKACHTVINYDLPWNPMVLQQRIGRVYRYGQTKPVVVFNIKVDSPSEAFADQRVHDYLDAKIEEITAKLAEVQDGDPEDIKGEVLGYLATNVSFEEIYKTAVEAGRARAEKQVDEKTSALTSIMNDPKGMLGIFRGLTRFDLSTYEKVASRVTSEHLGFFVREYLRHSGSEAKSTPEGLLSFDVPAKLVDVSNKLAQADRYDARRPLTATPVERATVDKLLAQRTSDSRLLRFGDAIFDAMVKHVQHGGFADGVATLSLPAAALDWAPGGEGTWAVFDLRVVRQEGTAGGERILRSELASFLIPKGGDVSPKGDVVESLHAAGDGPSEVDVAEAKRAYDLAARAASARLTALYGEVTQEHENQQGILPQPVQDVALAWVRAA